MDYQPKHAALSRVERFRDQYDEPTDEFPDPPDTFGWWSQPPAPAPAPPPVPAPVQHAPIILTPPSPVVSPWPILSRIAIAGISAVAVVILSCALLLTAALIAGPPPAEATAQPTVTTPAPAPEASAAMAGEHQQVRVRMAGDTISVKSSMCKVEDDCTVDYRGGTWYLIDSTGRLNP